jgi:hypothetical protein
MFKNYSWAASGNRFGPRVRFEAFDAQGRFHNVYFFHDGR